MVQELRIPAGLAVEAWELVYAALTYETKREAVLGKGYTHVSDEGKAFAEAVATYRKAAGI